MRKYIWFLLVIGMFLPTVTAGGMAFIGNGSSMALQYEHNQFGEIFYENGYENLFLRGAYDWKGPGNQRIWIIPVPARPEDVNLLDVGNGDIHYRAAELSKGSSERSGQATGSAAIYALFPISAPAIPVMYFQGLSSYRLQGEDSLQNYRSFDSEGITNDLVSAKKPEDFDRYLSDRNISLPQESRTLLDEYRGKEYTFIITSINNVSAFREKYNSEYIGIMVRFPAERIYFPLKPTRAYGSQSVVINLNANGYVRPHLPEDVRADPGGGERFSRVTYYTKPAFRPVKEFLPLFNDHAELRPFRYTHVMITGSADLLTDDLLMDSDAPEIWLPEQVSQDTILLIGTISLIYIILSMLSSLVAGILVFGMDAVRKKTLLVHGLWNCLTLIGFSYATRKNTGLPSTIPGRKGWYIIGFYSIFLISLSVVSFFLMPGNTNPFPLVIVITALYLLCIVPGYAVWHILKP